MPGGPPFGSEFRPYPKQPTAPFQYGPPNRTAANWALGLSLLPCGISLIAALVMAIVVLSKGRDGVDRGRGRAIAALCIVGGWAAVLVVVVVVTQVSTADRDDDGRLTAGGRSPVLDLRAGDCLPEDPGTGNTFTVQVAPCAEPHRGEVFATYDLEGGWTSKREASRVAEIGCADRFADYAGIPLRRADLRVLYFLPIDEASFRRDPGVVCIGVTDQPASRSLRESSGTDQGDDI